ncbi:unnamed protein product [Symbiodinium sp. CCMP2592]|nr:unnamed protein product [Symbiodinium sp. CCMP2592]
MLWCAQCEHGKFPDMCTLRIHFSSILHRGFQAFREPLEVRFPADADVPPGHSAPAIENVPIFQVKLVDGFTKSLCVQTIFAMIHHMGITADEISGDADFANCLASCKYLKGNFTYHERPEMYLFESLALCQRTSEKQSASALDLASAFAEAVRIKRAVLGQKSLRDVLGLCVSEYNKAVGRDHKVKQETQKIIYNVLRCPLEMREILAQVYGEYRHYNAGSALVCMCRLTAWLSASWTMCCYLSHAVSVPISLSLSLFFFSLSLSLYLSPAPSLYSVQVLHRPALTLENLAGDFYVPGTNLGKGQGGKWPEILEAWLPSTNNHELNTML